MTNATDRTGIEILTPEDCKRFLDATRVGRVAFLHAGAPAILPVNYRYHHGTIVFLTADGAKLHAAAMGQPVGFEIDAWDDELHTGWSVLVEGRAEEIVDEDLCAELDTLGLHPWAEHPDRSRWVRIVPDELTGRRIG